MLYMRIPFLMDIFSKYCFKGCAEGLLEMSGLNLPVTIQPRHEKTCFSHYVKTKMHMSAQLFSAFVFAT